jgi:hypothetical protein
MSKNSWKGSVAKFDFWGKIHKSGIKNSMGYRLSNARKSNFATEPQIPLAVRHVRTFLRAQQPVAAAH